MDLGINGLRVLVTAGASGIGRETARAFVEEGARVHICDVDTAALDELARTDPAITRTRADVSNRAEVAAMFDEALSHLGRLDVLVNNAGIAGPTEPTEAMDPDAWEKVVAVNLNGTFNVTRCAIPHLKRSPAGVIINMSSVAGRLGYPNRSPYATTKWGLIGFTKSLSMELGAFGIRVNAILPGAVAGERLDRVYEARAAVGGQSVEEIKTRALANQSLKAFVDPRDVAALAVFLASDAAKSISGQALPIDGDRQQTT
jgi:NAD(P)-dependent dehydrogenase (short-subunit alcohol dehydrogenase family)